MEGGVSINSLAVFQKQTMAHLADLFSLPEMCLLSQVTQYFLDHNLPYHSVSLFNDVKVSQPLMGVLKSFKVKSVYTLLVCS